MFAGEYEGAKWRQHLTLTAADTQNTCQVEKVIVSTIEFLKEHNPEALLCKNGEKIVKPAWQIKQEE